MNLIKLLGFGVLIWDVVFVTEAVLKNFEISPILVTQTVFIIVVIVTFLLSENLEIRSERKIFKYGLSWALVMIVLDATIAFCCLGCESFYQYSTWVNYAIVFLMPLLTVKLSKSKKSINGN